MTERRIPVFDIPASVASIRDEIDAAIKRVLDSGMFVLGPELDALEREFAEAFGVAHAVGVADGTDALHLALRALGVGPGDKVAVPALTFFASAEAVVHAGATPVVVDVDESTATMDPFALRRVAGDVKAVMPVHLYGHPADMSAIADAAPNALVLEDACQAHAAIYKGLRAGSIGDAAAFSFYPTKNLAAAGDAGLVTTSNEQVAQRVRLLRHHGQDRKDIHDEIGWNSRLDEIQAAILRVRLAHLDEWTAARRQVVAWYRDALAGIDVELPVEADWAQSSWHLFVIRLDDRDRVAEALRAEGIGCMVHYQVPLTRQPALRNLGLDLGDAPVAERIVARQLTLPLYPEMTIEDVEAVAKALRKATS